MTTQQQSAISDQRAAINARRPAHDRAVDGHAATLAVSRAANALRAAAPSPAHSSSPSSSPSHSRRAFSLVEMVIVVAIIVLLFALLVGVMTALGRGAEARRTQDALTLLDTAYQEWRRIAERDVTYGKPDAPQAGMTYEIEEADPNATPGTGGDHEPTDELIDIIHRTAPVRDLLSKIHTDLLIKHSGSDDITLVDAWDTEIITVHPGRLFVRPGQVPGYPGDPGSPDNDGTIRTEFENAFGFCTNRRLRFVSAGPDGKFGDLRAAAGTPAREAAKDNLYSYPLENTP